MDTPTLQEKKTKNITLKITQTNEKNKKQTYESKIVKFHRKLNLLKSKIHVYMIMKSLE